MQTILCTDCILYFIFVLYFYVAGTIQSLKTPTHRLIEFADRSSMEYAMDELDNTKVTFLWNKSTEFRCLASMDFSTA